VNILRDARWGRNQETLSEDPFGLSQMGLAYTLGLQTGDDPRYLLVGACAKHYAVHDGPGQ
jgi:beta-glucosidase